MAGYSRLGLLEVVRSCEETSSSIALKTLSIQSIQKVVAVLPDLRSEALPVHAVWPAKTPLSLRSRLAIDALTKELPSLMAPGGGKSGGSV